MTEQRTGLPADHPFTSSAGPANMRAALYERARGSGLAGGSRFELAGAMRQVIEAMMSSTDDDPTMESAAALVSQAAALLTRPDGAREYVGVAEGSLADGPQNFIDFSPFIGVLNPLAPPIAVSFDDNGDVLGHCTYGAAYEGPPGCVHGGFIAAGFDEVLGFAQAYSGKPGMTGNLNISYRSPTPLGREVRYVGRLDRVEGRKIYCSATLSHGDTLCAEAQGLFISMKPAVFERLLKLRLDEAND
ncbi:MAG: PaaI family thioesterase [Ilumatobacteraceae bacterium]